MNSSILLNERSTRPIRLTSKDEMDEFLNSGIPGSFEKSVDIGSISFSLFGIIDRNQPESPITEIKFYTTSRGEKIGFIDVLLDLCVNKNEQTLGFLKFREIENFLRDSNLIPSLDQNGLVFYPYFEKTIGALKEAITVSRGHRVGKLSSPTLQEDYREIGPKIFNSDEMGAFADLSVAQQSFTLNQVLDRYVRPFLFRDNGNIEVVLIDGTMIVVNYLGACAHCNKSLTSTMDYVEAVLRLELNEPHLMIVTDS